MSMNVFSSPLTFKNPIDGGLILPKPFSKDYIKNPKGIHTPLYPLALLLLLPRMADWTEKNKTQTRKMNKKGITAFITVIINELIKPSALFTFWKWRIYIIINSTIKELSSNMNFIDSVIF
jgi:hypothetical protein